MAQQRRAAEPAPLPVLDGVADETDLDSATPLPVELADDLRAAVGRAVAERRRLVVRSGGAEVAAIIPIEDLALLLRLEEAELDRIDLREARRALDDPENYPPVRWEQVKQEAGL